VERGVEARHLGNVWPTGLQAEDGGDGGWVLERGQFGELLETALDAGLEKQGARELEASVHDAVPDDIDGGGALEGAAEELADRARIRHLQVTSHELNVIVPEDAELQTARPGVDDQHSHVPTMPRRNHRCTIRSGRRPRRARGR